MPHVELPQAEFKVVLLGDTNTGKTCLLLRFVEGYYRNTSNHSNNVTSSNNKKKKNMSNQHHHAQQARKQSDEALLVTSTTSPKSPNSPEASSSSNNNNTIQTTTTMGAFFMTKRITVFDNMTCKILLWDTSGLEQFDKIVTTYYQNAAACILTYDIQNPHSLYRLQIYLNTIQRTILPNRPMVIAICACKCDTNIISTASTISNINTDDSTNPTTNKNPNIMNSNSSNNNNNNNTSNNNTVSMLLQQQGQQIATSINAIYCMTSAKDNIGIQDLFQQIAQRVLDIHWKEKQSQQHPQYPSISNGSSSGHGSSSLQQQHHPSSSLTSPILPETTSAMEQSRQNHNTGNYPSTSLKLMPSRIPVTMSIGNTTTSPTSPRQSPKSISMMMNQNHHNVATSRTLSPTRIETTTTISPSIGTIPQQQHNYSSTIGDTIVASANTGIPIINSNTTTNAVSSPSSPTSTTPFESSSSRAVHPKFSIPLLYNKTTISDDNNTRSTQQQQSHHHHEVSSTLLSIDTGIVGDDKQPPIGFNHHHSRLNPNNNNNDPMASNNSRTRHSSNSPWNGININHNITNTIHESRPTNYHKNGNGSNVMMDGCDPTISNIMMLDPSAFLLCGSNIIESGNEFIPSFFESSTTEATATRTTVQNTTTVPATTTTEATVVQTTRKYYSHSQTTTNTTTNAIDHDDTHINPNSSDIGCIVS